MCKGAEYFVIKFKKVLPSDPTIEKALVIVGCPGIGLVGKNAVTEIYTELHAEKWVEIYFDDFPSQAIIESNGMMTIPSAQIYYKALPKKEGVDFDLLILTSDFQPMNSAGIYEFSDELCKFFRQNVKEVTMVVATGALVPDYIPEKAFVHVSGTHLNAIQSFVNLESGLCKLMDGGFISGANGIIPAWCGVQYDMPGISLLAETIPMLKTDPRASRAILLALNERFGLDIPTESVSAKVDQMEEMLSDMREKGEAEEKESGPRQSYIG
jgi:proteasome assembly chaperone (PAC2) family protein